MANPKLSTMLIAIVVISFIASTIAIALAVLDEKYTIESNSTTINDFNKLSQITNDTKNIRDDISSVKEKEGIFDVIGGFFSNAWKSALLAKNSVSMLESMTDSAVQSANLGQVGDNLKITISAIIVIVIFIMILLSLLAKWYM